MRAWSFSTFSIWRNSLTGSTLTGTIVFFFTKAAAKSKPTGSRALVDMTERESVDQRHDDAVTIEVDRLRHGKATIVQCLRLTTDRLGYKAGSLTANKHTNSFNSLPVLGRCTRSSGSHHHDRHQIHNQNVNSSMM